MIVGCVNDAVEIGENRLFHLLVGKRSTSLMYFVYSKQFFVYYGSCPDLKKSRFESIISQLVHDGTLRKFGKNLSSTKDSNTSFKHWTMNEISFVSMKQLAVYQEATRLLFQVMSFSSFEEGNYIPVSDHVVIQQLVKQYLHQQKATYRMTTQEVCQTLIKELFELFQTQKDNKVELFLSFFQSPNCSPLTTAQRIEQFAPKYVQEEMKVLEPLLWKEWLSLFSKGQKNYPMLFSWVQTLHKHIGLASHSAQHTWSYFKKGFPLEYIAAERNLKFSTICDHLIEVVLCYELKDTLKVINSYYHPDWVDSFQQFPEMSFEEFYQIHQTDIPFLLYRIHQIIYYKEMREDHAT